MGSGHGCITFELWSQEVPPPPLPFRPVHGRIGRREHCGTAALGPPQGDADAHPQGLPAEWCGSERRQHALCGARSIFRVGVEEEPGELVAPQAGKYVAMPERARDDAREVDEELIAGGVAMGVVYLLEAIEVECQHAE